MGTKPSTIMPSIVSDAGTRSSADQGRTGPCRHSPPYRSASVPCTRATPKARERLVVFVHAKMRSQIGASFFISLVAARCLRTACPDVRGLPSCSSITARGKETVFVRLQCSILYTMSCSLLHILSQEDEDSTLLLLYVNGFVRAPGKYF
jgi:hypothetical protein